MFRQTQAYDSIIIGAGPSGLAAGYHLKQNATNCIIIESSARVVNSWHYMWNKFRLAQAANEVKMDGLNLSKFPPDYHLNREEIIGVFEEYAKSHELQIKFNTQVKTIEKDILGNYVIETTTGCYTASNLILALGARQQPKYPESITAEIQQRYKGKIMHSGWYQNAQSLSLDPKKPVLVIGSGLSALSIAKDLAEEKQKVSIACAYDDHGIVRNNFHLSKIPVTLTDLKDMQIENYGKYLGINKDGQLQFVNNKSNIDSYSTIIFATGFSHSYDLFDKLLNNKEVVKKILDHKKGVTEQPGLYVVGIPTKGEKTVTITQGNVEARAVAEHIRSKNRNESNNRFFHQHFAKPRPYQNRLLHGNPIFKRVA